MSKANNIVKNKAVKREQNAHEPLFHIAKRDALPFWKRMLVRVVAVLLAFFVCSAFAWIFADVSPVKLLSSIFNGSFYSVRRVWYMGKDLALLLGIALALTPAFVMRFWNIGGEGQVLMGALASVACVVEYGGKVSEPVLLLMMLAAALLAGALWGFIPSFFKSIWNSNETLFTLMMNYIALQLTAFMLAKWEPTNSSLGELKFGHLDFFPFFEFGVELTSIVVVAVLTVLMYIYLRYSKHGYEISVVGESENTARYVGISVKKVTMRTMILSGLLCGLMGFIIVAVFDHTITETTVGGLGFTAIMVSWMAKFNPLVMAGSAFVIVFLDRGAAQLVSDLSSSTVDNFLTRSMGESAPTGISSDFPGIIVGVILFFIVGCEFFINYQLKFRKSFGKGEKK